MFYVLPCAKFDQRSERFQGLNDALEADGAEREATDDA